MFELEHAIEEWKAPFTRVYIYSRGDITELEWHLRDVVDEELARGLTEQDAFAAAVRRVGDERRLSSQFEQTWNEMNPFRRYWKSMVSEFKGWKTRRSLLGYSFARTVSLVLGIASSVYLVAVPVLLSRGIPLWRVGEPLTHQGLIFLSVLGFGSVFNLFPFRQWRNTWSDWLRLAYSSIALKMALVVLLDAPGSIWASTEALGMVVAVTMLTVGPILWLKQVFRFRHHQPDLDELILSS